MRVLIAPDAFCGILNAGQAAEAIAEGWRRGAPWDDLTLLPLCGAGPGFIDVLSRSLEGTTLAVNVLDPLGRPVPAAILLAEVGGRRTAYVESAQACGLHLLSVRECSPMVTTSYGVGQLIQAAVAQGAQRIVVGVGWSATNDGGAGLLAALGAGDPAALSAGGAKLDQLGEDALAGLAMVRESLAAVELVLATDLGSPLLGLQGASATGAARNGATPQMAQQLESALGRLAEVARRTLRPVRDLMTGKEVRLDREPGAGAGGGLGYGLLLLGGHRVSAAQTVLAHLGFESLVRATDLVVTGRGIFDAQSLQDSLLSAVAQRALANAKPAVVIAGQVQVGRPQTMSLGVSGMYAVADNRGQVAAALADPAGTLSTRTTRVAATWSPRPDLTYP